MLSIPLLCVPESRKGCDPKALESFPDDIWTRNKERGFLLLSWQRWDSPWPWFQAWGESQSERMTGCGDRSKARRERHTQRHTSQHAGILSRLHRKWSLPLVHLPWCLAPGVTSGFSLPLYVRWLEPNFWHLQLKKSREACKCSQHQRWRGYPLEMN